MRSSSLNYFFKEKYFGYTGHVFDIDTQLLIDYFEWLKDQNIALETKKGKWAIIKSFLKATMEYYRDYKFIVVIPKYSIQWGLNHPEPKYRRDIIATKEEVKQILDFLKIHNYKYYLMIRFLVETGCRKGFLLECKYPKVNIEKRFVVSGSKTKSKGCYYFSVGYAVHLKMYLKKRRKMGLGNDFLFVSNRGTGYGRRSYNLRLAEVRDQLGIEKRITCHTFRKTLNTLRKKMGCSKEDRKILLGHKVSDVNFKNYVILDYEEYIKLYDKYYPYKGLNL